MEELRETSIHHTALKFSEDVKQMKVYSNLFKTVQVCVGCAIFSSINCQPSRKFHSEVSFLFQKLACSPEVCKDDMKHTLEQAMKRNGLETEIRNIVFHLIRTSIKNEVKLTMLTVSSVVQLFLSCFLLFP